MLSEPPRCRPVPVRALKGADSPRGLHRGHSPGHRSPPGARSTGGGWLLPASWPDPKSLRQVDPDHDERYRGAILVTVLGMVAEMERRFIRERQQAGIEAAKAKGVYKGRKPSVPVQKVWEMREAGHGPTAIAKAPGISRMSVHRVVLEQE